MSVFEIQYPDPYGTHAECVDAWDETAAAHEFRLRHAGEDLHLVDVIFAGSAEEVAV